MAPSSITDARLHALRPRDRWVSFNPAHSTPSRFDGAVDDNFELAFDMPTALEPDASHSQTASFEQHSVTESHSDFQSACEFQADWSPHLAQSLSSEHLKCSKSSEQPIEHTETYANTPADRLPIHISQMLHWSERYSCRDSASSYRSLRRPVYRPRQPQTSIQREEGLQGVRFICRTLRERIEAFVSGVLVFLWVS